MIHYLSLGVMLGLSAGLSPGPLLTLVVSETLSRGLGAGMRVAFAPLISDLPIVLVCLGLVSFLSDFNAVLGVISLVGSGVILKMGLEGIRTKGACPGQTQGMSRSLSRGVLVNILSPHPYLFWVCVGGPLAAKAWAESAGSAVVFLVGFYMLLIGSKVALALVTAKSRAFLTGKIYIWIMRILGGALCGLGLYLAWEGLELLGVIGQLSA